MNKKRNKIYFVCQYLTKGGAERVLSLLINYFSKRGYEVNVILLYENVVDYDLDDNVNIISLEWPRNMSIPSRIARWGDLRKIIKNEICISFLYSAIRDVTMATIFSKTPLIFSERNDPYNDPPGKIRRTIRDFCYHFANVIVFQTHEQMTYFKSSVSKKGIVIPNPIKDDLPYCFPRRDKLVVSICRLSSQKNIKMSIDAFKLFSQKHDDYIFRIFGEGELREKIQFYINRMGLSDKIQLMGFERNVHEKIRTAKMFISSSDYEGISNSMLEAMAMGLPVICTDCPIGGTREVIENNINGLLVPVGDTDSLYKCMTAVADDEVLADKLSNNAKKVRERYAESKICIQWEKLINSLE